MKFEIKKSILLKALSYNQTIVEKKTTIPILGHILLEATEQCLNLTSTNMDMSLIQTIDATVDTPGALCVPSQLLFDIVRKLSDQPIHFNLNPTNLHLNITCGRSVFDLPGMSTEEFPPITLTPLTHQFSMSAAGLRYLIDQSRFAICEEETRFLLNGIYFHVIEEQDGTLTMRAAATDTHRLACVSLKPAPEGSSDMPGAIASKKTITEIRRIIEECDDTIQVGFSQARIQIMTHSLSHQSTFSSRLIDAVYPDYQSIFDLGFTHHIVVPTKEFAQAIDRISTILKPTDQSIRLTMMPTTIRMIAANHSFGMADEEIDIESNLEEPLEINFNALYLLQLLRQIKSLETHITFLSADQAVLFTPYGLSSPSENERYILMPLIDDGKAY